ncbi:DMT family transporter [Arcanobacterium canis]
MAWAVLIISGFCEAIWATALGQSHALTVFFPSFIFVVAMAVSMGGLGWALKRIPVGTAYAVWTGIGSALTVTYAMIWGDEPVSVLKVMLITAIVACVAALKLFHDPLPSRKNIPDNAD